MIAFIKGEILSCDKRHCTVLTAGGVGYRLALPAHTLGELPGPGQAIGLYTSLIVREDAMELYGFATGEEREAFDILTGISRVGARTALAILSIFRPDDLQALVRNDDVHSLSRVPGIGAKTAQHILLELKYKLKNLPPAVAAHVPTSVLGDALLALAGLGYEETECGQLLRDLLKKKPDLDAGALIRQALKQLARGK